MQKKAIQKKAILGSLIRGAKEMDQDSLQIQEARMRQAQGWLRKKMLGRLGTRLWDPVQSFRMRGARDIGTMPGMAAQKLSSAASVATKEATVEPLQQSYKQGFIKRCSELGIRDWAVIEKLAARGDILSKQLGKPIDEGMAIARDLEPLQTMQDNARQAKWTARLAVDAPSKNQHIPRYLKPEAIIAQRQAAIPAAQRLRRAATTLRAANSTKDMVIEKEMAPRFIKSLPQSGQLGSNIRSSASTLATPAIVRGDFNPKPADKAAIKRILGLGDFPDNTLSNLSRYYSNRALKPLSAYKGLPANVLESPRQLLDTVVKNKTPETTPARNMLAWGLRKARSVTVPSKMEQIGSILKAVIKSRL